MSGTVPVEELQSGARQLPARRLRMAMSAAFGLFLASSYFSIAVNSISLGLMALLWAMVMMSERRWGVRPTPLDWFFLAYLLAEILATAFSLNVAQSVYFSRRVLLLGIVYFIASVIDGERFLRRAVVVLLGTATLVSLLGVGKVILGAMDATNRLGIFQFYMTTSELMMIAALYLLAFVIHHDTPPKVRMLALAALIPVLFSLYATVTRGAYLGFVAGATVIALIRNRKLIIPLVLVIALVLLFAPPFVENRVKSIVDIHHPENAGRIMIWTAGLRIFADHPLVGVGDIDLGDLLREYADPGYLGLWGHMHNVLLHYLVTLGLVGFIAVVAMFTAIAKTEWRAYRATRNSWFLGSLTVASLGVFAGLQVHGLTEWTFGDQEAMVVFWVSVGFAIAAWRIAVPGGPPSLTERKGGD
jgi:O-antigen ligase